MHPLVQVQMDMIRETVAADRAVEVQVFRRSGLVSPFRWSSLPFGHSSFAVTLVSAQTGFVHENFRTEVTGHS